MADTKLTKEQEIQKALLDELKSLVDEIAESGVYTIEQDLKDRNGLREIWATTDPGNARGNPNRMEICSRCSYSGLLAISGQDSVSRNLRDS